MSREKVQFANGRGEQLAAVLEMPDQPVVAYALFAHCFTCGKDNAAASRITRTLAASGIGVLRFDFTGLGGSDGDFANTSFSSNVEDLLAAADYLRARHQAPQLLVGHSLGGTAVLYAARAISEVRAVVTVAAPADPGHVIRQFGLQADEIETEGEVTVSLAGRDFRIRRQFLDDLRQRDPAAEIGKWKGALLVMHGPLDAVVSIDEAGRIFQAAKHPKSFVSLDRADHLLTELADAQYVATTIAAWSSRYLPKPEVAGKPAVDRGAVWVGEGNRRFLREVHSDDHRWVADEPKRVGGDNLGPDPYEHLLAALGTCTSMTIRMYANHKNWPLEDVSVELTHSRVHARDCEDCDLPEGAMLDRLQRKISFAGPLDDAQRARLFEIANRCPVHRTLEGHISIDSELLKT